MELIGLTQTALTDVMGVGRKHVNELCNSRRSVVAVPGAELRVRSGP